MKLTAMTEPRIPRRTKREGTVRALCDTGVRATSEPPGRTGPGHSRYRMNQEAEGRQAFCELGWYREVVYSVPEQGGSFFILFF